MSNAAPGMGTSALMEEGAGVCIMRLCGGGGQIVCICG